MKLKKEIKIDETNIDLETVVNNCAYSTEEQVIGKWIDGKPIYRKVLEITSPSSNSTSNTIATLPNECDIIMFDGYLLGQTGIKYPLNVFFTTTDYIFTYPANDVNNSNNNSVRMKAAHNSYLNKAVKLILEYTKTTD